MREAVWKEQADTIKKMSESELGSVKYNYYRGRIDQLQWIDQLLEEREGE
jgi:hypothetical protein